MLSFGFYFLIAFLYRPQTCGLDHNKLYNALKKPYKFPVSLWVC